MAETTRTVDGHRVKISNPDRVLYPETGFTKGDLLDYYARVGPTMLPYLIGRAVTLKRYPNGVEGEVFFQKNCPVGRPQWLHTAQVWSVTHQRFQRYCMIDDLPSLLWIANLATIEMHVSLAHADQPETPTSVVLDLDPGAPASIVECAQVALWLRERCAALALQCFPKSSGSKGIHLHIPLNTPATFDATKTFAHTLADQLAEAHPDLVVSNMRRAQREGRVLVDWSQNDNFKTTVCVYSLRGRARPTVSAPITWDEIEHAWQTRDGRGLLVEAPQLFERLDRQGDLYAPLLTLKQSLASPSAVSDAA
ncbi:MAG: bifunctional non-ous end joining protein LigD [Chloroflexota bacterium]|jgi:bifunctional non-homologous end joining protein LigD|nr:bifunctional non-ous end joining protein LigD [Chloroflexota bacterium]